MILNPKIVDALNEIKVRKSPEIYYLCCQLIESTITGFPMNDFVFKHEILEQLPAAHLLLAQYQILSYDLTTKEYSISIKPFISSQEDEKPTKVTLRNARMIVEEKVDEYRRVFSKEEKGRIGLRPGALGDKNDITKKLVKWFKETKFVYTMDDVINTARVYVDSCKGDNYKFLQAADYFISKDGRSKLSAYIDEFKDKTVKPPVKNTLDL